MMVYLSAFSEEKFDPKKWMNDAVQQTDPQDPVTSHLVDMETKLQMVSEEIAASLEEKSSAALLRIPRASRDVLRRRDDGLTLRSSVANILLFLKNAEGSSSESIATLAKVDTVKQRMEAAYETLQDAAGLTQLSSTVEDVFASGDLPRAAETLANMRHCLTAVGEVAEFSNIRKQLEVLEDRLDSMVQPRLTDALCNRKVNVAQEMRGILVRIGRFKSFESCYMKVHLKTIKKIWEDFDLRQQFNKLGHEKSEAERVSNYRILVPKLLMETMSAIGSSFISCVNLATGDAVPETKALAKGILDILPVDIPKGVTIQSKHLEALIELHNLTGSFARNIQHLFSDSDPHVLLDTLKAVYHPYESFKQKYGKMEHAVLFGGILGLDLRGFSTRIVGVQGVEFSKTVRRMEESIPQVILLLEAAIERCISFTGGSEADELILVLDNVTSRYISTLQENLKSLRAVCGVDVAVDTVGANKEAASHARKVDFMSNEEEWSFIQGALQILTVEVCLKSRTLVFEASLRSTLSRLSTNLSLSAYGTSLDQNQSHVDSNDGSRELSTAGKASLDVAALRLVDVPEKARELFNLLKQSKDTQFCALPLASQRIAAFAEAVNELVYDVLMLKVRQQLNDLSRLPTWSSVEEPSAFNLPSFSAYPQSYAINVGEYLLTLPQQLEPLAEGISNSDANAEVAQSFEAKWMFKVAEGAIDLYIGQLRGMQKVTDHGAQQLAVDIEYMSNVLSALSMSIPRVLATFHTCFSIPTDQLKDLVKSDSGNELDLPTANLVCKMRGVRLDNY